MKSLVVGLVHDATFFSLFYEPSLYSLEIIKYCLKICIVNRHYLRWGCEQVQWAGSGGGGVRAEREQRRPALPGQVSHQDAHCPAAGAKVSVCFGEDLRRSQLSDSILKVHYWYRMITIDHLEIVTSVRSLALFMALVEFTAPGLQ